MSSYVYRHRAYIFGAPLALPGIEQQSRRSGHDRHCLVCQDAAKVAEARFAAWLVAAERTQREEIDLLMRTRMPLRQCDTVLRRVEQLRPGWLRSGWGV